MAIYIIFCKQSFANGESSRTPIVAFESHKDAAVKRDELNAKARNDKTQEIHYSIEPVTFIKKVMPVVED